MRTSPPPTATTPATRSGRSTYFKLHEYDFAGSLVWTTADILYRDINPDRPGDDLAELVRLGVNGILTDVPELLRDLLAAPSQARQATT